MIPYIIVTIFGYLLYVIEKHTLPDLGGVFWALLTGTSYQNVGHWFIPSIILILFTYPLLRPLVKHRVWLTGFTILGILVSLCTFRSLNNANPLLNTLHFYGIFLLGMCASGWWDTWSALLLKYFWWVISVGTLAFVLIPYSFALDMETVFTQGGWTVDWSTLARLVILFPMLSLLMKMDAMGWHLKYLSITGKMSFGIFFYHGYLIYFLNSDWVNQYLPQNSWWVLGLNAALVMGSLWVFLTLGKKVLGKKSAFFFGY